MHTFAYPTPPASDTRDAAHRLVPTTAVTLRKTPERRTVECPPLLDVLQASYFRTSATDRELRRGIAKFELPHLGAPLARATLRLRETRSRPSFPRAAERYQLIALDGDDVAVAPADFDRPGCVVAAFAAASALAPATFAFDVTTVVAEAARVVAFRVKLTDYPLRTELGWAGSTFDVALEVEPARAEMRLLA